jgi:hypothetical protein
LNQKLISIAAGCGQAANANWLKPCIPGSSNHHCSCLKESTFNFTNTKQQGAQLAHCLASLGDQNGQINGPIVDEVICKILKPTSLDAMFHGIVITCKNLFFQTNYGPNRTSHASSGND